jgi:signal transduction histidine kinase
LISEQITLPYLWRRYLSLLRALLGASCLWVVLGSSRFEQTTFLLALFLLTVYSLVSTFWRWPDRADRFGLVSLTADLAMFFLCVWLSGKDGFWVTAFAAFYVLLSAASLHEWRQVLLALVVSLGFVNFVQPPGVERIQPLLLLLGMMGCVLALQKQSLLERLSNASRQSVLYRAEAQMAREGEKERIAADFHDGPLQSFISFQLGLETVRRRMERDPAAGLEELRELREVCDKQVKEMRTFVRSMRPVEVAGAGLATAVRSLVASFQKDTRIPAIFKAGAEASHDDFASSTELLQVIREALNNIQKHSSASRVTVTLERTGAWLAVTVVDDGTGFPFVGRFTLDEMDSLLIGPASIKSRVRGMNGDLEVESRPGTGSTLRIRVPV